MTQLLPVARHQQQAVVGAHPEHQDHEDPGRGAGHRLTRLRQQVDEALGHRVGEPHNQDGHQRDHGGAVDREQQHQHQRDGDDEQLRVEGPEDLLEVSAEAEVPGHVHPEAGPAMARDPAQGLAPLAQLPLVVRRRDDRVGEVALRRELESAGPLRRGQQGPGGQRERRGRPAGVARDLGAVAGGQPARALIDNQPARGLPTREVTRERLDDLGRLGALRQRGLRPVVGDLRQLASERLERRGEDQPYDRHQPLGPAAGDEVGNDPHAAIMPRVRSVQIGIGTIEQ